MRRDEWHQKPYYSLDAWCKNTLSHKCYRIALDAHMTCPNRDGTLDNRGCIFCSAGGSGDFAVDTAGKSIETQLAEGLERLRDKFTPETHFPDVHSHSAREACLIAYFQAYTNTYAPVAYLRRIYEEALSSPAVCGISVATRPDCLPQEVLRLLAELKKAYPDKFIWIELGLQTIHERTAAFLRRGYELPCFEKAFYELRAVEIPVIVHLILGLPGETREMTLESVQYLNRLLPFGVKLQLLHYLKGTDLGELYLESNRTANDTIELHTQVRTQMHAQVRALEKDEYLALLIDCIRHLSPEIVIHRLTGDGPRRILIAPTWSLNKKDVLNSLHRRMKALGAMQGDALSET